jgi:hypothetical protein
MIDTIWFKVSKSSSVSFDELLSTIRSRFDVSKVSVHIIANSVSSVKSTDAGTIKESISLLMELFPQWCQWYNSDKGTFFRQLCAMPLKNLKEAIRVELEKG